MDVIMSHEEAKKLVDRMGWDEFMEYWDEKYYRGFYSCSQVWYDDSKYICKLKGKNGDLIIGWNKNDLLGLEVLS